ncbi:unnamed protein product [Brachionus calyciflorus]|uniref:Uncharacterized protein n=1 Tax=Brachionus calyciflorus TaxID=104777 RepID=A0A814N1T6_9BILA|nr:unnamed protein product [Brachionus calyciflorus]
MIEIDVENILHSKNILAPYTNEGLLDDDYEEYEEQVEMNDGRIKHLYFPVAFSTNQLIQLSNKRDILVVDSTYKIIFQGYPIMIAGTVDFDKHIHPLAVAILK